MNTKTGVMGRLMLLVAATVATKLAGAADVPRWLAWDKTTGVVCQTPLVSVCLDRNQDATGPVVHFLPDGGRFPLRDPVVNRISPLRLRLTYRLTAPGGIGLEVTRDVEIKEILSGLAIVETFTLIPSRPLSVDLQIERPMSLRPHMGTTQAEVVCPLKNGWARTFRLTDQALRSEYRLGHAMTAKDAQHLALPVVQISGGQRWQAALLADPTFSTLFEVHTRGEDIEGSLAYCYAASRVPIRSAQTRSFGVWLPRAKSPAEPFGGALDAFFTLMLPDVPPGPRWLHDIAMVHYDYLSDNGLGWDRDLRMLAQWLAPAERRRAALCLHGWYDALGTYCYDAATGRMKDEWLAFGPSRKIPFTQHELKRRLRLAKDLGFRVLLYFGDGLAADSTRPGYHYDWAYRKAKGQRIKGWQGPDTFGPTYLLNPAHPDVSRWFLGYLDALLKAYGADVDGFVWDETFHARIGQIATQPEPAYCDQAMLALVKELARRVHACDPEKVFLASDCIGIGHWEDVPGYGMVAHGTYQDTHCDPVAWSYGLFPNWRNVLWSCNWGSISGFEDTRWGVETFGVPVAISNGYGDDLGPWEWQPSQRDAILQLFHQRLQRPERVRFLTVDPQTLLGRRWPSAAGDPLPVASPGQMNWALAANAARATASSQDPRYPAGGAIDGVRDDTGWGRVHGWASRAGQSLPQWLQVDFGQMRTVTQVVVISYQHEASPETATKWGVIEYQIQAWDAEVADWKTVVTRSSGRAGKVRVHDLARPVHTAKLRIKVTRVASRDGRVRLLQLEAWGPKASGIPFPAGRHAD